MALEIKGSLFQLLEQKTGTGSKGEWIIQPFLIETSGQYPKKVLLEAWNDQAKQVQTMSVGSGLTVSFEPEASEYNGKWYGKLKAWKIFNESGQSFTPVQTGGLNAPLPTVENVPAPDITDGFPF